MKHRSWVRTRTSLSILGIFLLCALMLAAAAQPGGFEPAQVDPNEMPVELDRGAAGLARALAQIRTRASIMMITAHPDDEDGGLLAYQTRTVGARGTLLTLNRGEGGQNAMSTDYYDALGLLRTQELLAAGRYYGVDQYWTSVIDYGFSKTNDEALQKWGHDRVLGEVVRVVRMIRPLVLTSVFLGAATDGHGNHEVAGQMAQEAYAAAGDPNRFPEQIKEGLRPWSPVKVYERVPNFRATKEGIYDYATDKYVPIRFFDYINQKWIDHTPSEDVSVPEGVVNPATGLSPLQMGREGLGNQKSQNGGVTIPPVALRSISYHRYGSRISVPEHEKSMYEGIDTSLAGIASLATGDTAFLKRGLTQISSLASRAASDYKPGDPASVAADLTEGLQATRTLLKQVNDSPLADPGKGDVAYELQIKERQFEKALTLALQLSFDVAVAPEKEPTGPGAAFGGPATTFAIAIPGQSFNVRADLVNSGSNQVSVESVKIEATDGKNWDIKTQGSPAPTLAGDKDLSVRFAIKAPEDAGLTKPYFSRPDEEQPFYNLDDPRYKNLPVGPYPLFATARITYRGADVAIRKYVEARQRLEGIGIVANPLLMGPAISVQVSPAAGAVPLDSNSFDFTCTLHSNVKGVAKGVLKLALPEGWTSTPANYPFTMQRDGDTQTVVFQVSPHNIKPDKYQIKAIAEYQGKNYEEGYRLVGYPGLRPYPYYRPATYQAVGVDVKVAQDLHIAFVPGTGDEVPRALQDLKVPVRIIAASDLGTADLSDYDAIVLGVRAYAVRPELRAANGRLMDYVKNGGALVVQYNLQEFDRDYGPYPFTLGPNAAKVVDEGSTVKFLDPQTPVFGWPKKITPADFGAWQEERGHGFMQKWDSHYQPLVETHDPDQDPQEGGLLFARYGKGFYVYDAFALYRQLPAGVPGAYRLLANLVSLRKNPAWR